MGRQRGQQSPFSAGLGRDGARGLLVPGEAHFLPQSSLRPLMPHRETMWAHGVWDPLPSPHHLPAAPLRASLCTREAISSTSHGGCIGDIQCARDALFRVDASQTDVMVW